MLSYSRSEQEEFSYRLDVHDRFGDLTHHGAGSTP